MIGKQTNKIDIYKLFKSVSKNQQWDDHCYGNHQWSRRANAQDRKKQMKLPINPRRDVWNRNWRWWGRNPLSVLGTKTPWLRFYWTNRRQATATSVDSCEPRTGIRPRIQIHSVSRIRDLNQKSHSITFDSRVFHKAQHIAVTQRQQRRSLLRKEDGIELIFNLNCVMPNFPIWIAG